MKLHHSFVNTLYIYISLDSLQWRVIMNVPHRRGKGENHRHYGHTRRSLLHVRNFHRIWTPCIYSTLVRHKNRSVKQKRTPNPRIHTSDDVRKSNKTDTFNYSHTLHNCKVSQSTVLTVMKIANTNKINFKVFNLTQLCNILLFFTNIGTGFGHH